MIHRSRDEEELAAEAVAYVKKHKHEIIAQHTAIHVADSDAQPVSIFMAGSPGAGKTEFSQRFLEQFESNESGASIVCINPDAIREKLPQYTGGNAHLFQKAVSIAVSNILESVLRNKQHFLLDGTLANFEKARENIQRCLTRNREVYIFYVYQDPQTAWRFTQKREKQEGRRILLDTFAQQYFRAKDTVNELKAHFGDTVILNLVVKDAEHNVLEYRENIDRIDDHLQLEYTDERQLQNALSSL